MYWSVYTVDSGDAAFSIEVVTEFEVHPFDAAFRSNRFNGMIVENTLMSPWFEECCHSLRELRTEMELLEAGQSLKEDSRTS